MDVTAAVEFVCRHHHGVLATRRRDGNPQLSPVTIGVDADGHLVVSSRERAMKTRNLRRHPYASVCVFTDAFFGDFVQVEGDVEIVSLPDAMDGLVDYYRRISGEHPDWDEYRETMRSDERVLVLVTPRRSGPDRSG